MDNISEMQVLRTANHSAFRIYYHIVLCLKYRKKALTPEMLHRCEGICRDTLAKWRCELVEFGGEADHVHLLIDAHPAMDLSRLVGNIKTVTARRLRSEYPAHLKKFYWKPLFWNNAYAAISVGGRASIETLLRYIQNQEEPQPKSGA